MRQVDKKYFGDPQSGRLNSDDSPFAITTNEWINAENVRTGSSDRGFTGIVESVGGNVEIPIPEDSLIVSDIDMITIGSVEDVENNRIVYFNYDNNQNRRLDQIICVYPELNGGTQYLIMNTTQIIGGLNFNKNSLIHSAKIAGDIVSFPDGTNNEPRKININKAIEANYSGTFTDIEPYVFPLNFSEVTLIKRPPAYTPNINKFYDYSFLNNRIANDSFEFAFQYQYYDGEVSVVSSYSEASKLNYGSYVGLGFQEPNAIAIFMDIREKIPDTVKIVNLICRTQSGVKDGGNYAAIVKTWNKENAEDAIAIQNQNALTPSALGYNFYNNISGETLASDDVLRPFDNVPIYSQTHEVSKGRYFLGNNTEGYGTPKVTSLEVALSNNIDIYQPTNVLQVHRFEFKTNDYWNWFNNISYSTQTDPNLQIHYIGYYVWTTINGVLGWYLINGTEAYTHGSGTNPVNSFAPPVDPGFPSNITQNDLTLRTNTNNVQAIFSSAVAATWNIAFNNINSCVTGFQSNIVGVLYFSLILPNYGTTPPISGGVSPYPSLFNVTCFGGINKDEIVGTTIITGLQTYVYSAFPQLSSYKFGIVFYDYAMRKCGVAPRKTSGLQLFYTFNTNISSSSPHQITFSDDIANYIKVYDTIIITGSGISGTYTVSSITDGYNILVDQTISSTLATAGTVDIYRNTGQDITTPARNFNYTQAIGSIQWRLSNTNAIDEIPEWAYYYTVVRTLNLRTRFFMQSIVTADKCFYVTKKQDGSNDFTSTVYSASSDTGLAISLNALVFAGLGYKYSEGDVCILTKNSGQIYTIPIIGQEGEFLLLKSQDIGTLGSPSDKFIFEIYTPYTTSDQEPYYEMGEIYSINSPTTSSRNYSTLLGNLLPDTFIFSRTYKSDTYNANAMSPNDLYYKRWDTDAGKVNVITNLGQTVKSTNIAWSDTYILGTQVTGSSTFRAGNETYVPDECGGINKLQLTSKVKDSGQGNVMLGLCSAETVSMYLGETQITDSTGKTQFFGANASQVISTINTLKGNYGCLNPESVSQYRGHVYFLDVNNGRVVQYSDNGLDSISLYKMSIFWKNWCKEYLRLGTSAIEALGDRPYIFTVVDPNHDELLLSLPKLSNSTPSGFGTPAPFNMLDYQGKTISFKLGTGAIVMPHWQSAFIFSTENFVTLQNKLYSFKSGNIWLHNQNQQNSFYGAYSDSKIMFTSNILPQMPKIYENFVSESNLNPNYVYFYNSNADTIENSFVEFTQESNLVDTDFVNKEGVWYATILRDINTPGVANGLLQGDVMRNKNMYVSAEFSPTSTPLELRLLQLGTSISRGHTI